MPSDFPLVPLSIKFVCEVLLYVQTLQCTAEMSTPPLKSNSFHNIAVKRSQLLKC